MREKSPMLDLSISPGQEATEALAPGLGLKPEPWAMVTCALWKSTCEKHHVPNGDDAGRGCMWGRPMVCWKGRSERDTMHPNPPSPATCLHHCLPLPETPDPTKPRAVASASPGPDTTLMTVPELETKPPQEVRGYGGNREREAGSSEGMQ